jgi:hypothetical protein
MENVGIVYGHLEHITDIWYIVWPFGNLVAIWYIFPHSGTLCQEKYGNPVHDLEDESKIRESENSFKYSFHNSIMLSRCISSATKARIKMITGRLDEFDKKY